MNKQVYKKFKFISLSLTITACLMRLFFQIGFANAALETKNRELQYVEQKIEGLTHILTQAQTQKQSLQQQLRPIEITIGNIENQLSDTNRKLQQEKSILTSLDLQRKRYYKQLKLQKTLLAQQVRAAYILGSQSTIKLLLNQDKPEFVSRLMIYYRYTNVARIKIIDDIKQTLNKLDINKNQIETQSLMYSNSLQQEQNQKNALQQQYQQRQLVLAQLTQQINNKSKRLSQLKVNQAELQALINKLKQAPVIIAQPKVPFAEMRGKLPWPTHGSITRGFNYMIDDSGTAYNGVLISAPVGQPIDATYPGQVVFANWLGGIGLLIIIQHDQNFMTLYGHARSILVKVGEYVQQGQEIGTVGQSGGYQDPGLFFQIRHNGIPINPADWCH